MTAQRDLSIAELDMVTAMTTYEKAKVELDRATGSPLEHDRNEVQTRKTAPSPVRVPSSCAKFD